MSNRIIRGYKFVQTCCACPEQYDVFDIDGEKVAYVHLSHGVIYAECPGYGGEIVYASANFIGDGCFSRESERIKHLTNIVMAIHERSLAKMKNDDRPITPEEFKSEMARLANSNDIEGSHGDMDDLMCNVLRSIGYGDGIDIFERAPKWYA